MASFPTTLELQQHRGQVASAFSPPPPPHQQQRAKKIKRVSKACDFCHNRSIRCSTSTEDPTRCQSCVDYDQPCTFDRPTKKRGAKGGRGFVRDRLTSRRRSELASPSSPLEAAEAGPSKEANSHDPIQQSPVAAKDLIVNLVDVYYELIYPLFPFFHHPTLTSRVANEEYRSSRPFYAAIMALCALASARVRDGAYYSNRWDAKGLLTIPSTTFFSTAEEAIPKDISASQDLDWLRATALLTLAALQNNQIRKMQYSIGFYNMLVRCDGLHDEKNWSLDMSIIEREERRRLFWSMYNFEVYAAAIWGSVVSCREAQSYVRYPAEVDDDFLARAGGEDITDRRAQSDPEMSLAYTLDNWGGLSGSVSWLQGWNFATDLYRVLEHAIDGFRKRSEQTDHTKFVAEVWRMVLPQQSNVLEAMMLKYRSLPARFKQTLPISLDPTQDRFSFQAANIAATMELVRMTLITSADATPEARCQVLDELIHTFANVPVAYLRAMSVPILHHLAGIGTILEQVFEKPVSEDTYQRVRAVILHMAELLSSLESGMGSTGGASARLHGQVNRMDSYMQTQRMLSNQHVRYMHPQYFEPAPPPLSLQPPLPAYDSRLQESSSQYVFPAEVFDEWNWAFDFTHSQC